MSRIDAFLHMMSQYGRAGRAVGLFLVGVGIILLAALIRRLVGEENEQRIDPTCAGLQAELKTGLRAQVARVSTSTGYLGSPPPRLHFGMGPHGQADYVRLTWPDGVLQSELEVVADQPWHVTKVQRKPSSCPVLFSWDGNR